MYSSLVSSISIFVYIVGFSSCSSEYGYLDTVYSNSWDDCEAFHATDFSSSDEMLNDTDIYHTIIDEAESNTDNLQNTPLTHISPDTNQVLTEVPDQILNDTITPHRSQVESAPNIMFTNNPPSYEGELPSSRHKKSSKRRLVVIGKKFEGTSRILQMFKNLEPPIVNPHNMSQKELDEKFLSKGLVGEWKELEKYPAENYKDYWGLVCDYFWEKSNPEDERFRACYINTLLNNHNSLARVFYRQRAGLGTKADVLTCSCYYYLRNSAKPDSNETKFAVHKYKDDEYFLLNTINRTWFTVETFLTGVFLPTPIS